MCGRNKLGFSLVELAVVLAVIAIVATVAAPSLPGFVAKRRVAAAADDLFASLVYARSEAIRQNQPITVQAIGGDWSNGWQVADPNNAGGFLVQHAMQKLSVAEQTGVAAVTYAPSGRLPPGALPQLVICDSGGKASRRQLTIDPSGMPNLTTGGACP